MENEVIEWVDLIRMENFKRSFVMYEVHTSCLYKFIFVFKIEIFSACYW